MKVINPHLLFRTANLVHFFVLSLVNIFMFVFVTSVVC